MVVGCFRMHLSAALTEAAWAWGNFTATEADRLAPLVDNLPNRCGMLCQSPHAPAVLVCL